MNLRIESGPGAGGGGGGGNKTHYFDWKQIATSGTYRGSNIGASSGEEMIFAVPDDMMALVSLEMVGIMANVITAQNIELRSNYASQGEDAQAHAETDLTLLVTSSIPNEMFFYSIASVFTALAAGDICGIRVDHKSIGSNVFYLFVKLVYTPV